MRNFNEIYQEVYKENYHILQDKRNKICKKIIIIFSILFILGAFFSVNNGNFASMLFAISIAIALAIIVTSKSVKEYKKTFKEKVIGTFVKKYCNTLNYNYDRGVSPLMYSRAEFERFDEFHSEDYIYGALKSGYEIFMSEVITEEIIQVDGKGNCTTRTLFRGLFAQVKFNKNINDTIKLRTNSLKKIFNSKKRVEMDSGQFEQIYDVYSSGKIATMQLFTSEIIDMFIDIKEKNKIAPELTLKGNTMYIRFKTGNVFETKLTNRPLEYDTLKKYYNMLHFALEITEKMLNNIQEAEI